MLFKRAPEAGDLDSWLEIHRHAFGQRLNHHVFGWDEPREGDISAFLTTGFVTSHGIALSLSAYAGGAITNPSLTVRPIVSDSDWELVIAQQIFVDRVDFDYPEDGGTFRRAGAAFYQKLAHEKRGNWWGAFQGDELVGSMGLFFDEQNQVGRFQNVSTSPAHRRQHVCTTLLDHIVRHAFTAVGAEKLVIATGAEDDNAAIPNYQNFGFKFTAPNFALKRINA